MALMLGACAPSRVAQCQSMAEIFAQAPAQPMAENQPRAVMRDQAALYLELATQLRHVNLHAYELKRHRPMAVDGYLRVAESWQNQAKQVNRDGTIPVLRADSDKAEDLAEALEDIREERRQGYNQIRTATRLIEANCRVLAEP